MIVRAGGGAEPGLELASPRDGAERGSQVSFSHPHGYAIMQALIHEGVIGDFRAPDIIRYAATASPASCIQPAGLSGRLRCAQVWLHAAVYSVRGRVEGGGRAARHPQHRLVGHAAGQIANPPLSFADSPQIPAIVCQLSAILTSNSCGQMRKRQRVT